MRRRVLLLLSVLVMAVVWGLSSCEKMIVDDESSSSTEQNEVKGNLILKISVAGVTPMETTRAEEAELSKFFTRLNIVAYQNGKKVKGVNQDVMAENFGTIGMSLEPGTYQVLVVAHSSEGSPSLADPSKIDFTNKVGFTDTFFSYSTIEVKAEAEEHAITMKRVTSMLRFIINDEIPADVTSFRFLYIGGSAAFDATKDGVGCEQSQQLVTVDYDASKPAVFDLYTILRKDLKGENIDINLTVTAYRKNAASITKDIKNIPLKPNAITEVSGNFFTDSPGGDDTGGGDNTGGDDTGGGTTEPEDSISTAFKVTVLTEWADTLRMKY